MGHTPYGYRIEGGRAVIDEEAAEQVRLIYKFYLEGDSLITAANKAGIKSFHSGVSRMLRACLVSFENNADKSQRKHLERIMQKPFTIFPKSATLIDPTK